MKSQKRTHPPDRPDHRAARRIVEKHFPNYPRAISEREYIFLTPRRLLATSFVPVIPEKRKHEGKSASERIDRIEEIFEELLAEYERLPFQVSMGNQADMALYRAYNDFTGKMPRDVCNVDGEPWFPEKEGHIEKCRRKLADMHVMHHHQRDSEFDQKVSLARSARDYWHKWTGREAPLKGDNEAYKAFLADLIEMCGRENDWTADNLMRTFHTYQKRRGKGLKT